MHMYVKCIRRPAQRSVQGIHSNSGNQTPNKTKEDMKKTHRTQAQCLHISTLMQEKHKNVVSLFMHQRQGLPHNKLSREVQVDSIGLPLAGKHVLDVLVLLHQESPTVQGTP